MEWKAYNTNMPTKKFGIYTYRFCWSYPAMLSHDITPLLGTGKGSLRSKTFTPMASKASSDFSPEGIGALFGLLSLLSEYRLGLFSDAFLESDLSPANFSADTKVSSSSKLKLPCFMNSISYKKMLSPT